MEEIRYSPRCAGRSIEMAVELLSVIREGSKSVIYIGRDVVALPIKKYQQLEQENKDLTKSLEAIRDVIINEKSGLMGDELAVYVTAYTIATAEMALIKSKEVR